MATLQEHQAVLLELLEEFDRVCKKHHIQYQLFAGTALGAVRHRGFIPWDDDLDVALLRTEYDKLLKLPATEWGSAYYFQGEYSAHWPWHFSKLRKNNTTCLEKYHPKDEQTHQGIYIDIFPLDQACGCELGRKLQYLASRVVLAKSLDKRGYETSSKKKKAFIALCRLLPTKCFLSMTKGKGNTGYVHSFLGGTSSYKKGLYPRAWMEKTVLADFEGKKFPICAEYDQLLTAMYGDYMCPPDEAQRQIKKHALLVDTEKDYTAYEGYRDGMCFEVHTRSIR